MFTDETRGSLSQQEAPKRRSRATKPRQSAFEKLPSEDLRTRRLDEASRSEFDTLGEQFGRSAAEIVAYEGEDLAAMDDARFDQRYAAGAERHRRGMAIVHFLAPRILKMRDGDSKRKWRSFLAKFRKDEKLN